MVVTVVGLGFVGLTAAVGFATMGHQTHGVEIDDMRRNMIARGTVPFYEPGLNEHLSVVLNQSLFIHKSLSDCVKNSDCILYCVSTPVAEDGSASLNSLFAAITDTLPWIEKSKRPTLAIKSTIPPGTVRNCIEPLIRASGYQAGQDVDLVCNPEFLREGSAWEDFMNPDRVVIGADTLYSFERFSELYSSLNVPMRFVNPTTAEFIKYLSNALLSTMISFSNEMAEAAFQIGDIAIGEAFHILHQDRRWTQNIMSSYVYPGCGFGGYCLPKDTQAMQVAGKAMGADMSLLSAVLSINNRMPEMICERIMKGTHSGCTIGILGLAFKPFTDDVRDTSAAKLIRCLQKRGVSQILCYDPIAEKAFQRSYPDLQVEYPGSLHEMMKRCDKLAITTAWPEFRSILQDEKVYDFRYMR